MGVLAQDQAQLQRKIRLLRQCGRIQYRSAERDFRWRVLRKRTAGLIPAQQRAITIVISEPLAKSKWRPGKSRGGRGRGCVEESNTWELT